jgi:fructose-specific component phosphotransferase system IIB-like protein
VTRRQQILEALQARLQAVQTANGYQTDAGLAVILGELPQLGADDPDEVMVLAFGDEQPEPQDLTGRTLFVRLPVRIAALAKASLANVAWTAIEALIGDIKTAIELPDVTLGGLLERPGLQRDAVRTNDRDPGSLAVGMTVTYFAPYLETWGAP